ncbi:hypothetical protein Pelo_4855 [Pelomyxa schiedti]|nr:hypothetical protein Pelo_4855 [Pelomyxa schiedti]
MAKALVDGGGWPNGFVWPIRQGESNSEFDIRDHIRGSEMMTTVCSNGHLEVARWIAERFNLREPWEFAWPLAGAVTGAHLDVAKWVVTTSPDVLPLIVKHDRGMGIGIHGVACQSGSLEVLKWVDKVSPPPSEISCGRLFPSVTGTPTVCADMFQYIAKRTGVTPATIDFRGMCNLEVLKWATTVCPTFSLSQKNICDLCELAEAVEDATKWVEASSIRPNVAMLQAACKNRNDNVQLVQWFAQRVRPSKDHILDSFLLAMGRGNRAISTWLDSTFNILNQATSSYKSESKAAGAILMRVCKAINWCENQECVEWLLNHPAMATPPQVSAIVRAIQFLVSEKRLYKTPLLLIEKFHITSKAVGTNILSRILSHTVQGSQLSQVKKVISMGEFTKEEVAQCLANPSSIYFYSSKSVKWLITHFNLGCEDIRLNKNALLRNLLSKGHPGCAEWVINNFHITLDEFLSLGWDFELWIGFKDLLTWQMMLRVFPGITVVTTKRHFMSIASQTPEVAQFTMRVFPDITTADIVEYWSKQVYHLVPFPTTIWLGDAMLMTTNT